MSNLMMMARVVVEKNRCKANVWIPTEFAVKGNILCFHTRFGWVGQWNVVFVSDETRKDDGSFVASTYRDVTIDVGLDLNDLA
jgi:hypothetical protein